MSGGSLDYAYQKVDMIADAIIKETKNPLHVALAKHLKKVSTALHDLEWVLDDDYGSGDEDKAIRAVLHPPAVIEHLKEEAELLIKNLEQALKDVERLTK